MFDWIDSLSNSHCVFVEVAGKGAGRVVLISAYFQFGGGKGLILILLI